MKERKEWEGKGPSRGCRVPGDWEKEMEQSKEGKSGRRSRGLNGAEEMGARGKWQGVKGTGTGKGVFQGYGTLQIRIRRNKVTRACEKQWVRRARTSECDSLGASFQVANLHPKHARVLTHLVD